jgi:nucleotide-binding universal stress UspA family protein
MISKILIATDGSETALKASRYAIDLAKQLSASIIVLSVIDHRSLQGYYTVPPEATAMNIAETIDDFLKEMAKKDVATVKKLCAKKGVSCRAIISTGHPSEEIIKEAERSRSNLIVLGSHGKSALAAVFLGSVTYGVVHKDTQVPVLIVRRREKNHQ